MRMPRLVIVSLAVVSPVFMAVNSVQAQEAPKATLPLVLYDDAMPADPPYYPAGVMGENLANLNINDGVSENPAAGSKCIRINYDVAGGWCGVCWQNPANDWGDKPGGWNLTGATKLSFYARGENGGEKVEFFVGGGTGADKPFKDTLKISSGKISLTKEWKQYSISVKGADLSRVKTGFQWAMAGGAAPITIYLDEIKFEGGEAAKAEAPKAEDKKAE